MAKSKQTRKPLGASSKALIALALLLIVTVFVSFLAVSGLHYGTDGIMQLLPWVPTSVTNWPQSITPGISMGGGTYVEFSTKQKIEVAATEEGGETTTQEVDATNEQLTDTADKMRKRLNTVGYTDTSVTVIDGKIRVELPNVETLDTLIAMVSQKGEYSFTDPNGVEFMNGSVVTKASAGAAAASANSSDVYYVVNLSFNEEGKQAFGDATAANINGSLNVYRDGTMLAAPGVSEAITQGEVSLPLGLDAAQTACAAAQFVTGPYSLTLTQADRGAISAQGNNKLSTFLWVSLALIAFVTVYCALRYRVSAVTAVWTMWIYVLLSMFFFATVVNARLTLPVACALLLALVLQGWIIVEKLNGMAKELRDGRPARAARKTGFSLTNKKVWIVIGAAFVLSLLMMLFSFSSTVGNTLCGCVVAIALVTWFIPSLIENLLITFTGEKSSLYLGKGK